MRQIRIDDKTFEFTGAALVAYHCDGDEADWNLALDHAGETLWLSGTVKPGPRSREALIGAEVTVDARSLDEVVGALLGREVTLYADEQDGKGLAFALSRSQAGVRLAATFACDWDRALGSFSSPGLVEVGLDIDAAVDALHPGGLP